MINLTNDLIIVVNKYFNVTNGLNVYNHHIMRFIED